MLEIGGSSERVEGGSLLLGQHEAARLRRVARHVIERRQPHGIAGACVWVRRGGGGWGRGREIRYRCGRRYRRLPALADILDQALQPRISKPGVLVDRREGWLSRLGGARRRQ